MGFWKPLPVLSGAWGPGESVVGDPCHNKSGLLGATSGVVGHLRAPMSQVYRFSVVCLLGGFSVSVLGVGCVSMEDVELWINCLMDVLFICFDG